MSHHGALQTFTHPHSQRNTVWCSLGLWPTPRCSSGSLPSHTALTICWQSAFTGSGLRPPRCGTVPSSLPVPRCGSHSHPPRAPACGQPPRDAKKESQASASDPPAQKSCLPGAGQNILEFKAMVPLQLRAGAGVWPQGQGLAHLPAGQLLVFFLKFINLTKCKSVSSLFSSFLISPVPLLPSSSRLGGSGSP